MTIYPTMVVGDQLQVAFPTSLEGLQKEGPIFLTQAFQAAGVLAADNRVAAITHFTEFFGGGMGRKAVFTVGYERMDAGLHTELFVKFPREFGDPLRDLFAPLMEPEVRFALLSRQPGFPIAVPRYYFADYHRETCSGLLITERVSYGNGVIEPAHEKCVDFELSDPLGHYQALTRTMARLAGHHKSGQLGDCVLQAFPFDPEKIDPGSRIPYTPELLAEKIERLRAFAESAPQLLPAPLRDPAFLKRFALEAPLALALELPIRAFLNHNPAFVALCHWNMNLDNAWFWRDAGGELHAGLLDWGAVGQMNVAQAFYGMTCAAETDFLNQHRSELMDLFVSEYQRCGGPKIDAQEFALLYRLSVAVLGIAWILDAPSLVAKEIPDFQALADRFDPRLRSNFLARAQLQLLVVFLNEWKDLDIGAALRRFASTHAPQPTRSATMDEGGQHGQGTP